MSHLLHMCVKLSLVLDDVWMMYPVFVTSKHLASSPGEMLHLQAHHSDTGETLPAGQQGAASCDLHL